MFTANGKAAIFDAVPMLCERGLPILPCNGKKPFHDDWQHRTYAADEVLAELSRVANPMIGLRFGPGSCIDIEADSSDEEDIFATLFAGCEPPITPTFKSTRGKHRLFAWHDRLSETGKGIINLKGSNGAKLGIRIGADGKGAQSIIPPSPGREWLVGLDDCDPAPLPDLVIERLLAAARKPKAEPASNGQAPKSDATIERARKYLAKIPPAVSGQRGHDQTFHVACVLMLGFGLDRRPALALFREWNQLCQPPWADHELEHKIDDALEQPGERGYLINGDNEFPRTTADRNSAGRKSYHLTDCGNARRFADLLGSHVRYCHPQKKWFIWDNRRWAYDTNGELMRRAKLVLPGIYVEASEAPVKETREALAKWAAASEKLVSIRAMTTLAESEQPIPIAVESLDADPWLLNCQNGTVDLRTGELRPHRQDDFLTKLCPVEYATEAGSDPPLWLEFLDTIFAGNAKLIRYLQCLVGSWLPGLVVEHLLPILYGSGANGKSVFISTICGMLGSDYAMRAPPKFLMATKSERHPTELADLHGKRLVAAVETGDGGRLSEVMAKELSGGDNLRARRMREDHWEFKPSHSLVIASNYKPTIRGTDFGIWRRVRLIPFLVTIPEAKQNKMLAEKLRAEWPAILRWAVNGCIDWQRNGFDTPPEVLAATDSYKVESDTFAQWCEECCQPNPAGEWKASAAYRSYRDWCEAASEHPITSNKFSERILTVQGVHKSSRRRDGYYYLGCNHLDAVV